MRKLMKCMLAAGLLLAAGVCRGDVGVGTARLALDTMDYTLTVNSALGSPIPDTLTFVASYYTGGQAQNLAVVSNFVYVADLGYGIYVLDVANAWIDYRGRYSISGGAYDVCVTSGVAYVVAGSSLQVLDVSNPGNIVRRATLSLPGTVTGVEIGESNRVYLAAGSAGVLVVDVSSVTNPVLLGVGYATSGSAFDLVVRSNVVYVADWSGGLSILDATAPTNWTQRARLDTAGQAKGVHESGGRVYLGDGTTGLLVIDVSSATNPVLLGALDTEGAARGVFGSGSLACVGDSGGGLLIVDATQPSNLYVRMSNAIASAAAYGVSVVSDRVYVAYGSSGFQWYQYGMSGVGSNTAYCWQAAVTCRVNAMVWTPGTQYVCKGWVGTGSAPASGGTTNLTFAITNDTTVTWVWQTNYWGEWQVAGGGGTVSAGGWFAAGSNVTVTATASNGWHVVGWSGNTGGCALAGAQITVPMTRARALAASFALNTYTIEASAGAGGTIAPAGAVNATYGTNVTYVIVPDVGNRVADVVVDGASVGAVTNYTFVNVTAGHTIAATFVGSPAVVVSAATDIGVGVATVNGRLTSDGGAATEVYFCWGTNDFGTTSTGAWPNVGAYGVATNGQAVSNNLTGLIYGYRYWYRLFATNGFSGAWSGVTNFVNVVVDDVSATGGTITNYSQGSTNWTAHIFTNVGSTSLTFSVGGNVEYLVVGGGGGGGRDQSGWPGGGGGAGGYVVGTSNVTSGGIAISVGQGGPAADALKEPGSNSVFGSIIAFGGGHGGFNMAANPGGGGGSGGGGSSGVGAYGAATNGQGNVGGLGGNWSAGGGGGAGGVGANMQATFIGGAGGKGLTNSFSGVATGYAGGGGGGSDGGADTVGYDGGGAGSRNSSGVNGTDGTGGGGGGGGPINNAGGKGGSGIVIVRYERGGGPAMGITNTFVTNVAADSARLQGTLMGSNSYFEVWAQWGMTDGTNNAAAWSNRAYVGSYLLTNGTTSTNISYTASSGITRGREYYYTFYATNAATNLWARPSLSFTAGATIYWKGKVSTDWGLAGNWTNGSDSASVRPGFGTNVVIDGRYTPTYQPLLDLSGGTTTVESLTISNTVSGYMTLSITNGNVSTRCLYVHGNSTIGSSGVVTHVADWSTSSAVGSESNRLCMVVDGNLDIAAGGKIDVSTHGYPLGCGPGKGPAGNSWSSSHGGIGGIYGQQGEAPPGSTYGSVTNPTTAGSGSQSGPGGGVVVLKVGGTLTVNGTLSADGCALFNNAGSPAGGSVNITAGSLAGTNRISAIGGPATNRWTGGGGGRIAIVLTNAHSSSFNTFLANSNILAAGGAHYQSYDPGAAGTVYLKGTNDTYGKLIVNNLRELSLFSTRIPTTLITDQTVLFDAIICTNNGKLAIGPGAVLDLSKGCVLDSDASTNTLLRGTAAALTSSLIIGQGDTIYGMGSGGTILWPLTYTNNTTISISGTNVLTLATNFVLGAGGILTHEPITSGSTENHKMMASVPGDFTIDAGGVIWAHGLGFDASCGPGTGSGGYRPSSHGGVGGYDNGTVCGPTYGSVTNPVTAGSGGGTPGGGVVVLRVGGTLTVNGPIDAEGSPPAVANGGGGAGGSVNILAGNLAGTNRISAAGAPNGTDPNNSNGAGGGGRIAITLTNASDSAFTYFLANTNIAVYGGKEMSGGSHFSGAAGTLYLKGTNQAYGRLIVDNLDRVSNHETLMGTNVTDMTVGDVVIQGAGRLCVSNTTLTVYGSWSNALGAGGLTNSASSTGMVQFAGTGELATNTIYGSTVFPGFGCTTAGKTLRFESGTTNTILTGLTITGTNGSPISLMPLTVGQRWYIKATNGVVPSLSYLIVSNSTAITAGSGLVLTALYSTVTYVGVDNTANFNTNWAFPGAGVPPTVTVTNASGIGVGAATMNGTLTTNGGAAAIVCFYWGPFDGGTNAAAWSNAVNMGVLPAVAFSNTIGGLPASTIYYYRCWASNVAGVAWAGSSVCFTTLQATVGFVGTAGVGGEGLAQTNLAVALAATSGVPVVVSYAVTGGTAGYGVDYSLGNGSLGAVTIAVGQVSATLAVSVVHDQMDESDETFAIVLSGAVGGVLGANTNFVYTILDNDTAGVSVFATLDSVTEGGASNSYTVVLNTQPAGVVTVAVGVAGGECQVAGVPLVFNSGNWATPQTVTVWAVNDLVKEAVVTNTLMHTVTSLDGFYNGIGVAAKSVQVLDNDVVLLVASPFGLTQPRVGAVTNNAGTPISATVTNSPVEVVGTQYVCVGWTGSGSAPASGVTTNVTFAITNDSTIAWAWQTNYWGQWQVASGEGQVASGGWFAAGSNVTVTATASPGWYFSQWGGDTNGCVVVSNRITAPMTQARSLAAHFVAQTNVGPVLVVARTEIWLTNLSERAELDAAGSWDPNGDGLVFSWRESGENPRWGLIPVGAECMGKLNLYFPEPGLYRFVVQASDGLLLSTNSVTITVHVPGLVGTVCLSGTAQPVAGVEVNAYATSADASGWSNLVDRAITDSNGGYALENLSLPTNAALKDYYVRLTRLGFTTNQFATRVRLYADRTEVNGALTIERNKLGSMSGVVVRAADGVAIQGAFAELLPLQGKYMTSLGDGSFTFINVPYGTWALSVRAPNYRAQVQDVNVGPGLPLVTVRMEAGSTAASVSGRVVVAGTTKAVMSAAVSFGTNKTAMTDARGVYGLGDLQAGSHVVTVSAPGYGTLTFPNVTLTGGVSVLNFQMYFSGSGPAVVGRLVDKISRAPIRFAVVGVESDYGLLIRSDVSDPAGYFFLRDVPTGTHTVRISGRGYWTVERLTVVDQSYLDAGDIEMRRHPAWRAPVRGAGAGRVLSRVASETVLLGGGATTAMLDGRPSLPGGAGMSYRWRELPGNPVRGLLSAQQAAQAAPTVGGFAQPGVYVFELRAAHEGTVAESSVSVTVLAPGLSGNVHVSPSDGVTPVDGADVLGYEQYGAAAAFGGDYAAGEKSDVLGNFVLQGLSDRTYWVVAEKQDEGQIRFGPILKRSGCGPLSRRFAVNISSPDSRVTGTIRATNGVPLQGVRVVVAPGSAYESFRTSTDAAGRFALYGVPRGSHALLLMAPGYQSESQSVTVNDGADLPYFMRPTSGGSGIRLSGTITNVYEGLPLPVPNAEVVLGAGLFKTYTDADGRYEFEDLPTGYYFGIVRKPGYKTRKLFADGFRGLFTSAENDLGMDFVDVGLSIRGIVVNGLGQGVSNATVRVAAPDSKGFQAFLRKASRAGREALAVGPDEVLSVSAPVSSDLSGAFQLSKLPDGERTLVMTDSAGVSTTNKVHIAFDMESVLAAPTDVELAETLSQTNRYWSWVFGYVKGVARYDEGVAEEDADPDGDGVMNRDEYVAGTDPLRGSSYPRIEGFLPGGGMAVLQLGTLSSGRLYDVWSTTNLVAPAWSRTVWTNVAGAGTNVMLPVTNGQRRMYYRTGIRMEQ